MITREKLPTRREAEHFEFVFRGRKFEVGVGRHPDGRIAEVFLSTAKSGAEMQAIARDAAITISIMLQHGAPLPVLRAAVTRDHDGNADSPIGALLDRMHELEIIQ
ncbi:hypothetical protein [Bosea massiliensis]|uniref:ribonucleoside-diphosphate reductase n=1 Tax=Bosea massiliensis TaxID=151419 RepID=A0ABW0P9K8_9HYPH